MLSELSDLAIPAVVLAAGEAYPVLAKETGVLKATLSIANKPMLEYVLEAVSKCKLLTEAAVVGLSPHQVALTKSYPEVLWIPAQNSWLENVYAGAEPFKEKPYILFLAADIPLIQAETLTQFLTKALSSKADIYYPVMAREDLEKQFPEATRTYARLKEGQYTGGNAMLLSTSLLFRHKSLYEKAFARRKSVLKLVQILGLGFLIRLLLGQLSLAQAEQRISEILSAKAKAVVLRQPELFMDVDKKKDLLLVEEILRRGFRE